MGGVWKRVSCHGNGTFYSHLCVPVELLAYQVSMFCAANWPRLLYIILGWVYDVIYPASSWFLAKRERNHCEQPSAFPSSMRELVTPHVMHLMPSSFVNNFFAGSVWVQKNQNVSHPKCKRTIQFSLYFCYHSTKMTLFLHDFYVRRPLIRLSTRMAQKSQQSASKVACIGSLCV